MNPEEPTGTNGLVQIVAYCSKCRCKRAHMAKYVDCKKAKYLADKYPEHKILQQWKKQHPNIPLVRYLKSCYVCFNKKYEYHSEYLGRELTQEEIETIVENLTYTSCISLSRWNFLVNTPPDNSNGQRKLFGD